LYKTINELEILTQRNRVVLEKLMVAQMVKKFSNFMELVGLLSRSQELTTEPVSQFNPFSLSHSISLKPILLLSSYIYTRKSLPSGF
jgi:hypothetical protein